MKNFCIFLLILFSISCDNKEKYEAKWTLDIFKSQYESAETPLFFKIENDSIKFNYWSFNHSHKYPLIIQKNNFSFNNWSIKTNLIADTLSLQNSFYIRDNNDSIFKWLNEKPITKIELPKINSKYLTFDNLNRNDLNYYILFGKRLDNNQFSLQLNDKYDEIKNLPEFLFHERASRRHELTPFYSSYLLVDKTTPMKYLEDIFFEHKKVNQLKICFINDIHLNYNDSLGLYYEYKGFTKKLPPFRDHDDYQSNTSIDKYQTPPPPPIYYSESEEKKRISKLILLRNNNFYFNQTIIETKHLKDLIKLWIKENNTILSLYDLQSEFYNFLEMNAIINSAYQEVREEISKIKFKKPLSELNREELEEVKIEKPVRHIWDYSIPHFNRIVKKEGTFYGLEVSSIK